MTVSLTNNQELLKIINLISEKNPLQKKRIRNFLEKQKKLRNQGLGSKEFRCFKCQAIIQENEDKCPHCGWSWK